MKRLAALLVLVAAPAAAQEELRGTWRGDYVCAQGHTAMTLTIEPAKDGSLRALFHFEAPSDNPEVPTGCYEMRGHVDAASGRVVFRQRRWLLRPPDYVMVDLAGQVAPSGERIEGRVLGPFCTTFRVDRLPGRSDAEACRTGAPLLSLR